MNRSREVKSGDYFLLPFAGKPAELLVRAVEFNAPSGHWLARYPCFPQRADNLLLLQTCARCTPSRAKRIIEANRR